MGMAMTIPPMKHTNINVPKQTPEEEALDSLGKETSSNRLLPEEEIKRFDKVNRQVWFGVLIAIAALGIGSLWLIFG
jgi:hypothetical protein